MSRFVTEGGGETSSADAAREDAWAKAQAQIEALRSRSKPQEGKQEDGKSLYEVLQANKANKQAEFEEQAKLKNQFRTLDDDEIDFLDSVQDSVRAKEAAVKKETAQELEEFRKQKLAAERVQQPPDTSTTQDTSDTVAAETWKSRKRRRKDPDGVLAKARKVTAESSNSPPPTVSEPPATASKPIEKDGSTTESVTQPSKTTPSSTTVKTGLNLAAYDDSDED